MNSAWQCSKRGVCNFSKKLRRHLKKKITKYDSKVFINIFDHELQIFPAL